MFVFGIAVGEVVIRLQADADVPHPQNDASVLGREKQSPGWLAGPWLRWQLNPTQQAVK